MSNESFTFKVVLRLYCKLFSTVGAFTKIYDTCHCVVCSYMNGTGAQRGVAKVGGKAGEYIADRQKR